MTIRAVLFDLDDTLYAEADFFRSGFAAVARHLGTRGVADPHRARRQMEAIHFSEGREQVFDKLVRRLDLPADWVPELVHVFRSHAPQIALDAGVASLLMRLRGRYRLGCVTDGWPDVQRRKVATLGLGPLLDAVVYTGDYARDRWKPSPFPFATCCGTLSVSPSEAVHVGDNPERDVRGARNAGLVSIRVRGGGAYFRDVPSGGDAADGEVTSVEQMEELLDGLE